MVMSNKKWFTLLELVIAIGIIAAWLIAVFVVLNSWFSSMAQARGQIIAINLAREWAETVFNLRDTNLRKWSGKKDLCWLNKKSLFATDPEACENERRMGYYDGGTGNSYVPMMVHYGDSLVPLMNSLFPWNLDIFDGLDLTDRSYEIAVSASGEFMPAPLFSGSVYDNACLTIDENGNNSISIDCQSINYSSAGRFYRAINHVGLYDKSATVSWGNNMQCEYGSSTDTVGSGPCGWSEAKEFRFCSEVQYVVEGAKRKVMMCSVMTNFKE